jgi:histidinol dehydrogenase
MAKKVAAALTNTTIVGNGETDRLERELLEKLDSSIKAFNKQRVAILKKAFEEEGDRAVSDLEKEYDVLRDAYFEILKRQLDRNNNRYEELMGEALSEAGSLEKAIARLESVGQILKIMAQTVSLVGRILIVLGI